MQSLPQSELTSIPFVDVGSDFLTNNPTQLSYLETEIGLVQAAARPLGVMVASSESANTYLTTNLGSAVDLIFPTISPFADGNSGVVTANNAAEFAFLQYEQLVQTFPTQNVVISAIGWPSSGTNGSAVGSVANEEVFWSNFVELANQNHINYFGFEAFDSSANTSTGFSGGSWGLYTSSGVPKGVVKSFSSAPPPQIVGTVSGQQANVAQPVTPFAGVSVVDPNNDQIETLTIAVSSPTTGAFSNLGSGSYNAGTGIYSISGSAATVTSAIQGLMFTPAQGLSSSGGSLTVTFTIADADTAGATAIDSKTTVTYSGVPGLILLGNEYEFVGSGGTILKLAGSPVTVGEFGIAIAPVGAVKTATGYEVAWGLGGGQYIVWNIDGNGNYTGAATGILSSTSYGLEIVELTFGVDLNGDGNIGPISTAIASNSVTGLVQIANQYALENSGGGIAAWVSYGGNPLTVGQFGSAIAPVGAKQTGSGYEVVWSLGGGQFIVWNTDSNGNFTSAATGILSGTSATLEAVEANFGESFPNAGTAPSPTTIVSNGTTTLAQVGNLYALNPTSGGPGPLLEYQGSFVTAGQFGSAIAPVGAKQTATGYEVAWSLGGSQFIVWNTDSNGNFTSAATGILSGTSTTLEAVESNFAESFSNAGAPASVSTILSNGTTTLAQVGNLYELNPSGGGPGPLLEYQGAFVTAGQFGTGIVPIGAVKTGTGYEVAWSLGGGQFIVWNIDNNGNYTSAASGILAGTSYALEQLELTFGENLNGDGSTGPTATPIASNGVTGLVQVANQYALENSGDGIVAWVGLGGNPITFGQFGSAIAPVGAKQAGNGYEVVWNLGGGQFIVWNTDSNGNYTSAATGILSGTSATLEAVETNFGESFPNAGAPASVSTILSNGTTTLAQVGNLYELNPTGGGPGPLLEYQGSFVTSGQFGTGIAPVGAKQTGNGYEVAWSLGGSQFIVWNTDSNGNYTSAATGILSGTSTTLEAVETNFGESFPNAGSLASTSTIVSNGTTVLAQVGNLYEFNPTSGGTGPLLEYQGSVVTFGQFGTGIAPVGVKQTGNGYEVAWSLGGGQFIVCNTDSNGNYTSAATGILSGTSATLEAVEANFGDGTFSNAGSPASPTTIASNGTTTLARVGNLYEFNPTSGGTGPLLEYQGSYVAAGQFGSAIVPVGAVKTATGYEVAWSLGGGQFIVWNTDNNGNYASAATGVVAGQSFTLEGLESTFGEDLNSDGRLSTQVIATGPTVDLSSQSQSATINLGANTASASAGLSAPSLAFLGTPDTIILGTGAAIVEYALQPSSGIETVAGFVLGTDELNIDLAGAANSTLLAYDTKINGNAAIALTSSSDPSHGIVLTNVSGGLTAATLLTSHTNFVGGHALIS